MWYIVADSLCVVDTVHPLLSLLLRVSAEEVLLGRDVVSIHSESSLCNRAFIKLDTGRIQHS